MIQEKFPITSSGKMFDGHYKLIRPLSTEGGTADVWLAIDTNTIDIAADGDGCVVENGNDGSGMLVAIKIYRPKNALDIDGEQRFRDEFKIVYECRHENLLQPTNFSICEGIPYLVLPYCERGSSEQLVGKRLSADEIWKFILNVSSGLNRLHTNVPSIVHQDIKPANILIDNTGEYAITDFGISAKRGGEHGFYYDDENSGTMAYMAPERFHDNAAPMSPSDIWAFGATLYEILMGSVPFGEDGGRFQTEKSTSALSFANVPSDIQRLISDCLAYEPGQRPSAAVIKEAATARKYPLRGWQKQAALLGGVAMAFVVAIVALFWLPDKGNEPPTTEELYNIALANIDSVDMFMLSGKDKELSITEELYHIALPNIDSADISVVKRSMVDSRFLEPDHVVINKDDSILNFHKQENGLKHMSNEVSQSRVYNANRDDASMLTEGVYKQTRYQQGNMPEQDYPYEVYRIVKATGTIQMDLLSLEPLSFLFRPYMINKKDVIDYTESSFDYRWICDMDNHKTIKKGTSVREHYDSKFKDHVGLPRLFQALSGTVPVSDNPLIGVWKRRDSNIFLEHYKVYTPKFCYLINIRRANGQAHIIQYVSGRMFTVKYQRDGNTKENDDSCQILWFDTTSYSLTYQSKGQSFTECWEQSELPLDFVCWFK